MLKNAKLRIQIFLYSDAVAPKFKNTFSFVSVFMIKNSVIASVCWFMKIDIENEI